LTAPLNASAAKLQIYALLFQIRVIIVFRSQCLQRKSYLLPLFLVYYLSLDATLMLETVHLMPEWDVIWCTVNLLYQRWLEIYCFWYCRMCSVS